MSCRQHIYFEEAGSREWRGQKLRAKHALRMIVRGPSPALGNRGFGPRFATKKCLQSGYQGSKAHRGIFITSSRTWREGLIYILFLCLWQVASNIHGREEKGWPSHHVLLKITKMPFMCFQSLKTVLNALFSGKMWTKSHVVAGQWKGLNYRSQHMLGSSLPTWLLLTACLFNRCICPQDIAVTRSQ